MDGDAISFGPFRLVAGQRLLLEGEKPVRLGSRAFDVLTALVERAGEVIGKKELIARAWPETFVEESNLKIQVGALRRALGDGQGGNRYVVTVPGQGYKFVAPLRRFEAPSRVPSTPKIVPARAHNLPFAATRMVGREDAVAALVSRFSRERLVTIVGPGGIGKTTVALAVAERMIASYEDGVWLIDLAPLGDPRRVPNAVATVLGLEIRTRDPLPGLIASIRDKRMLLLIDTCEHVIDAAASLAAAVLSAAPNVNILATSREPLGVSGERKHRLGPLSSPQLSSQLTAAEAAAFPAVQLFVERVRATVEDFALTDANTPLVVEICRRLDGLPLAIEFAASRVAVLGVEGLAARLDHSLPLSGTRRVGRHRTMRAVVGWSYGLLNEDEQLFFRALGIFAGGFTVEAASAVTLAAAKAHTEAMDRLADLVAKSLVVADVSGAEPRFRLLDTTRAYAIEKLDESGERGRIARRHAAYYRDLFERAEGEAGVRTSSAWLADYAWEIDNLRAALDWAFSPGGEAIIGVALTAGAVPLWMRLSLLEECRSHAKQALGVIGAQGVQDPREEMRLYAALGASTSQAPEMGAAFTKALEIAESLGDFEHRLRALSGLYFYHTGSARYRAALPFAQRFHDLATSGLDPNDRLIGERMLGAAKHFFGDQIGARRHLEHVLIHDAAADHERDRFLFQSDSRVVARTFLARVLWLQGFPDQAVRTAELGIGEAQATGHAISFCLALALAACPTALWVGDLAAATRYTQMLLDHSREHRLPLWSEFGARFRRAIAIRRGEPDEIAEPNFSFRSLTGLTELAEALAHAGRIAEALAAVEAGIEQSDGGWITPELLRLKGELLLSQNAPAVAETSEALFRQALKESRQQEALSWELRAATSLARLLRKRGRHGDAIACLHPVHDRFTEGFGTADLIAAKQLLDELSEAGRR
jgi:predicted ATPase/DNA-binding winged helix-turn-helix (wHTH) protein